jgi:hypothetical protein
VPAQTHAQTATAPKQTPVMELRVTSDMDKKIGEGGIDIRIKGGTFYQPELSLCNEPILDASTKWAQTNKLAVVKRELTNKGVTLHMANPKQSGFFELIYRLKAKDKFAQLTLTYFKSDGTPVLPEYVNAIDLDKLQDDLVKAITCTAQSKGSSH